MWTMELISAELPPRKPTGLAWDDDGSDPDPYVRIYVGDRMVWESPTLENTSRPVWNAMLPYNVVFPKGARFRLEVRDRDSAVTSDPMGSLTREGLPGNLLPNANARLMLDTLANVTMRISDPRPHAGVGLTVEVHSDELLVLEVAPYSPAQRAGLHAGDRIVAIGPERVMHLSDQDAFSRLSLASDRGSVLWVKSADNASPERKVVLDKQPLWQVL